ncbi:neuroendocrine protein 7B2 isoform X1 [Neodiprion pinetum]|uniref:neuroendocrine protein 7B2 isoform X1 n=1 Tax=Neodiprion pinetum TaxID=441929 RepID=UPI001EDF7161|nr:uncharacterized protein LOC124215403 isoform X1 [Neodiprion pinetum]
MLVIGIRNPFMCKLPQPVHFADPTGRPAKWSPWPLLRGTLYVKTTLDVWQTAAKLEAQLIISAAEDESQPASLSRGVAFKRATDVDRCFVSTQINTSVLEAWRHRTHQTLIQNRTLSDELDVSVRANWTSKEPSSRTFSGLYPVSIRQLGMNSNMHHVILLLSAVVLSSASMQYMPPLKQEHLFTDILLRELVDRMGNEFVDVPENYMDFPYDSRLQNEYEKVKEIPADISLDYEGIDTPNPNPSIRDQEYLQHSSLWSHQRLNNNNGNDRHRIQAAGLKGIKDEKTETNLPAYCTPPNPCPIGYTSVDHCITNFENTAAFSRDYQSAQDCMCDKEHMVDCTSGSENNDGLSNMHISNSDFDQIVEQFQHENPFFQGEKLPIAAKKGINVGY